LSGINNYEHIKNYEPLFGSWKVGKLIGKGTYGAVYWLSKKDLDIEQRAAVKIIDIGKDKDRRNMVSQEIQNLLKLNRHPNIVFIKDWQVKQQNYDGGYDVLILMELLRGLDEKNMSRDQVVKLGVNICLALEACAKYNIIHRDIKPANILLSPDGQYQLSDFGISRTLSSSLRAGTRTGTHYFVAPEVEAYQRRYDVRADICSLGLTMYWLLNGGNPPFFERGDGDEAIRRRFRGEKIPPIRGVSAGLNAIILKACAYEPDSRYRTAREMRGALENDRSAAGFNMPAAAVNITGTPGKVPMDAEEHFRLGTSFYRKKEYEKASEHYLIAAEQGHAKAQFFLGEMYEHGTGVTKDVPKAVEWYHKAAEQGNADAQYTLGTKYRNGKDIAKNEAQAIEWFRKAAEQENTQAQYALGRMYEYGEGVAKDVPNAVEWYRKAADHLHGNAIAALKRLGYHWHVPADIVKRFREHWFLKLRR
jgi:serine/threonine protein kinase